MKTASSAANAAARIPRGRYGSRATRLGSTAQAESQAPGRKAERTYEFGTARWRFRPWIPRKARAGAPSGAAGPARARRRPGRLVPSPPGRAAPGGRAAPRQALAGRLPGRGRPRRPPPPRGCPRHRWPHRDAERQRLLEHHRDAVARAVSGDHAWCDEHRGALDERRGRRRRERPAQLGRALVELRAQRSLPRDHHVAGELAGHRHQVAQSLVLHQPRNSHHRPVGVVRCAAPEPLEVNAQRHHLEPAGIPGQPLHLAAVVVADEHGERRLLPAGAAALQGRRTGRWSGR